MFCLVPGSKKLVVGLFQPITIPFAWSAGGGAGAEKKKIGKNDMKQRKLQYKHPSAECGIWNLAQTPQKNLKFHEAKPSEISNFSVVFESQIPNSTLRRRMFMINTTTSVKNL